MRKVIFVLVALLFIVGVGLANAAPNTTNLSQKGSVMVFPKIDTTGTNETYIFINNDNSIPVSIACYWVKVGGTSGTDTVTNPSECSVTFPVPAPTQAPIDFYIQLTKWQPIMFAASDGQSLNPDIIPISVNPFGVGKGYLACWAVDDGGDNQISFNHLSGRAAVLSTTLGYEYNAWGFAARTGVLGAPIPPAGTLTFDAVKYDAMPQYLIFDVPAIGAVRNDGYFWQNLDLTLIPGTQNFTNLAAVHGAVKAVFDVWNENETRYSGVSACMWCWMERFLDDPVIKNGTLFRVGNIHSAVVRFRVQGASGTGCIPAMTEFQRERCLGTDILFGMNSPLLGLAVQYHGPAVFPGAPTYLTTVPGHTAGSNAASTFIWGPVGSGTPER